MNLAETLVKMVEHGKRLEDVVFQVSRLQIAVVAFDADQAQIAASLWESTRVVGMSLGDRACLALAEREGVPVVTADRTWHDILPGIEIRVVR